MVNFYLVTILIKIGEYEKSTQVLTEARCRLDARSQALMSQVHHLDDYIIEGDTILDGYEFIYSVVEIKMLGRALGRTMVKNGITTV